MTETDRERELREQLNEIEETSFRDLYNDFRERGRRRISAAALAIGEGFALAVKGSQIQNTLDEIEEIKFEEQVRSEIRDEDSTNS